MTEAYIKKTILLVDDVRMFLEIQKEFLQHSPVNILTAKNGMEAFKAVACKRPDLIFMDLEMPEMNGVDCCRAIKYVAELAAIPLVMITARGDETSRANCKSAGCDDFLTKPLDRKQFLDTASRFLVGIERREHRMPVNVEGAFHSRGTTFPCVLSDLSFGGAFIKTDFVCEVDRVVPLAFALPNGSAVRCQVRITWFRQSSNGSPPGFGVNFVLLPKETREALSNFIKTAGA
jgi:CheY-like chemotaxis protein